MEEENQVNALNNRKVIEYTQEGINLLAPEVADQRYIAYVRPKDIINLNFDLKTLKVDVVKGDVHIIFPNGSTITLASMAAIGFDDSDAPQLVDVSNGNQLSLDDFLNTTQVLSYDKAVLILTNRDEYKLTEEASDVVRTASEQEADLEAGNPISGVGETDIATKGEQSLFINPNGITISDNALSGAGNFVVTIYSTDLPFLLDKANIFPGDVTIEKQPSVSAKVLYGSVMQNNGNINMNGRQYGYYTFASGFGDTDDSSSLLAPNVINQSGSSQNIFINNNTDAMRYVLDLTYGGDVFPSQISLVLPKTVVNTVNIEGIDFDFDDVYVDADGNRVYQISNPNPRGEMQFTLSFPENTSRTQFDITYKVQFLNPSTGEVESIDVNESFVIVPLSSQADLDSAGNRAILSSTPNPIDANTGSGDDVIITGGGVNHVNSNGGNDRILTGQGNDIINVGEGNNKIWGSGSTDAMSGGSGDNTIYYNNFKDNIDPAQTYFKDSYYNTYRVPSGLTAYFGLNRPTISNLITNRQLPVESSQILNQAAKNGSTYINKMDGADILNGINNIYLSQNRDVVYLSAENTSLLDKSNATPNIYGGGAARGINNKDEIQIYTSFKGTSIIDIAHNTVTLDGKALYKFYDFNSFVGGDGNDTFVVAYQSTFDSNDPYTFKYDGGKGSNVLDFSQMGGAYTIRFDANTSTVVKLGGTNNQTDMFNNIQKVIGTAGDDSYMGSFSKSYEYNDQEGNNTLSYKNSTAGVTLDLKKNAVYKGLFTSVNDVASNTPQDTIVGNFTITLSDRDDSIISAEGADYKINMTKGRDTISYRDLTAPIELTLGELSAGAVTGTIVKSGGGTDTVYYDGGGGVQKFYGTTFADTFYLNKGLTGTTLEVHGAGGDDTLSYDKLDVTAGQPGVTFNFGSSNYVSKNNGGGLDYFYDISQFEGSKGNDRIIFTNISKLSDISGININAGDGDDTVVLINLPDQLSDLPQVTKVSAQVRFDTEGKMEIYFGQYQDSASDLINGSSIFFENMEGVEGTKNNDILTMSNITRSVNFDGKGGDDVADYRLVSEALEFNVGDTNNGNVTRGDIKDTIKNTEVFYGGTVSNIFYFKDSNSSQGYTFYGNEAATENTVSYENSSKGIIVDLKTLEVTRPGGIIDHLFDITSIIGSSSRDVFYAYEEAEPGTTITVNGSAGVDVIDFSKFDNPSNALDITFTGGEGSSIDAGNIIWNLIDIEGIVGTKFDDIIKINGSESFSLDGGDTDNTKGGNTLDYSLMTDATFNMLISGSRTNVSKSIVGSPGVGLDTVTNFQNIILSNNNDVVNITNLTDATVKSIDGGGANIDFDNPSSQVGNSINFSGYAEDLNITISDDNANSVNSIDVAIPDYQLTISHFQTIGGSRGNTTFHIGEGTIYDGFYLVGHSQNGSSTVVDFSSVTAAGLVITFSGGDASISGGVNAEHMRFANINKFVLTSEDDTVYGASAAFTSEFDGGEGEDTLDYSKLQGGSGIIIDFAKGTVYKDIGRIISDTYENFEKIIGTAVDDTVIISDVNANLDYQIDLGGHIAGNIVEVDLDNVIYTLANSSLTANNTDISIANILNANILKLGDKDDTVVISDGYLNSTFKDVIDGGSGNNTLDASTLSQGIAFDATTNKISGGSSYNGPYGDIQWDTFIFTSFTIIKGSQTADNYFYSDFNTSRTYIGGNGSDTLSYFNSTGGVTFNIGDSTVSKSTATNPAAKDTYQDVDVFIGSTYSDKFILNDDVITNLTPEQINNLKIFGKDPSVTNNSEADEVIFDMTNFKSLDVKGDSGSVQTAFTVGTTTYTTTFNNVTKFTFNGEGIHNVNVEGTIQESYIFNAESTGNIINYNVDNFEFNSISGQAIRIEGTQRIIDTLEGFAVINYSGSGTATFNGSSSADYTYEATGNATQATVNYENVSDVSLVVRFQNPDSSGIFAVVEKGETNQDHIGKNIKTINGGRLDDTFVLADISNLGYQVTIDGRGGRNSVSFEQLNPNGGDFNSDSFATGINGYILKNITVYDLTNKNDNFILGIGDAEKSFQIDGLDGEDKLDYSAINGYDITVNFVGNYVQRRKGANQVVATDSIYNFEYAVTADGNDTFILSDDQRVTTGKMDGGAGNNTLDLTNLTPPDEASTTKFTYQDGVLTATYTDGSSTYNNFQNIKLLSGTKDVTYTYTATDVDKNIMFSSDVVSAPDNKFTFNAGSSQDTFDVDLTNSLGIRVKLGDKQFLTINNMYSFLGAGSNAVFKFTANGNQYFDLQGGDTNNDSISYANVSRDIILTIDSINDRTAHVSIGNASNRMDTLKGIENITLGTGRDTVNIVENTGNSTIFTIDGGSGIDTISLEGFTKAVAIDFTDDGTNGVLSGYNLIGFEDYALTGYDDSVIMAEDNNYTLSGGAGTDTIDYSGMQNGGVSISMKTPTSYDITKGGNKVDRIEDFEHFILTNQDDTVEYYLDGDGQEHELTIDFRGGTGNAITFATYNGSETTGLAVTIDGASITATFLQDNLTLISVNRIIGSKNADTFTFTSLDSSTLTFIDGGGGVNTLAFGDSVTNDMTFNLNTNTITIEGGNAVDYVNISGFTSGGGNDTFILGDIGSTGLPVSYVIDGGAGTNSVDYSDATFNSGAIEVTYNALDDIQVKKPKGNDTLKNIQNIKGTKEDDKFNINTIVTGMVISGGGSSSNGDTVSFTGLSEAINMTLSATPAALVMNINDSAAILNDIINVDFNPDQDNQITVAAGAITSTVIASFTGKFTLNLKNIGDDSTDNVIVDLSKNFISYTTASSKQVTLNFDTIDGVNLIGSTNDNIGSVTVYIDENTKPFGLISQVNASQTSSQNSSTIVDLTNYNVDTYISLPAVNDSTFKLAVSIGQGSWDNSIGEIHQVETVKLGSANDHVLFDMTAYTAIGDRSIDANGNTADDIVTVIKDYQNTANRYLVLSTNEIQVRVSTVGGSNVDGASAFRLINFEQLIIGQDNNPNRIDNLVINILDNFNGSLNKIDDKYLNGTLNFRGIGSDNTILGDGSFASGNIDLRLLSNDSSVTFLGKGIAFAGFTTFYLSQSADHITMDRQYLDNIASLYTISAGTGADQNDTFVLNDANVGANTTILFAQMHDNNVDIKNADGSANLLQLVGVSTLTFNTPTSLEINVSNFAYSHYNITLYNPGGAPKFNVDHVPGITFTMDANSNGSLKNNEMKINGNVVNISFVLTDGTNNVAHSLTITNAPTIIGDGQGQGQVTLEGYDDGTKSTYISFTNMSWSLELRRLAEDGSNNLQGIDIGHLANTPTDRFDMDLLLPNGEKYYFGTNQVDVYLPSSSLDVNVIQSFDDYIPTTAQNGKDLNFYGASGEYNANVAELVNWIESVSGNTVTLTRGGSLSVYMEFYNFNSVNTATKADLNIGKDTTSSYDASFKADDEENEYFMHVNLSDKKDSISIWDMEDGKIVSTGEGSDNITLLGNANHFSVNQINEDRVLIDGVYYNTGGSYLVVSDGQGHNMYFLNSDLNSVIMGGGNYFINNKPINEDSSHWSSNANNNNNNYPNNGTNNSNESNTGGNISNTNDTDRETWWDTMYHNASDNITNNNADHKTELTNVYSLLEETFKESEDNIDLVLDSTAITNDDNAKDTFQELSNLTTVNENYVEKEEIESNFKLSEENSEDPNKLLHELLHKNSTSNNSF